MTKETIEIDRSIDPLNFKLGAPRCVASVERDGDKQMFGPKRLSPQVIIEEAHDGTVALDIAAESRDGEFETGISVPFAPADALRFAQALIVAADQAADEGFVIEGSHDGDEDDDRDESDGQSPYVDPEVTDSEREEYDDPRELRDAAADLGECDSVSEVRVFGCDRREVLTSLTVIFEPGDSHTGLIAGTLGEHDLEVSQQWVTDGRLSLGAHPTDRVVMGDE